MATRYRLPDALGGGECTIKDKDQRYGPDRYVRATVGEGDEAITVDLLRGLLTEVKAPLPEEPPVGAIVMVDGEAVQHFDEPYEGKFDWASVGSPKRLSWVQLCDLALPGTPTRLVPDPFAEPVTLPLRLICAASQGEVLEIANPDTDSQIPVLVHGRGTVWLDADQARTAAGALMAAADAAEKEQS